MTQTLIMLHGWGGSAKSLQKIKENLLTEGCNILIPDLPGFGEREQLNRAWSLDDYVKFLFDYCEEYQVRRLALFGHSFGGQIAIKFAAKYPERIDKLILCAAAGIRVSKSFKKTIGQYLARFGKKIFGLPGLEKFTKIARRGLYFTLREHDYEAAQNVSPFLADTFRNIVSEDISNWLPKIKKPTLILWGEQDKITPLADAYLMHSSLKNSRLIKFPQGNHYIQKYFAEDIAGEIGRFLVG